MNRFKDAPIADIVKWYESGLTVKEIGDRIGVGASTITIWLNKVNAPRRNRGVRRGHHFSNERTEKVAEWHRGRKRSIETCKNISESRKCKFNGLNGYGHTKLFPDGYVKAYCPLHPFSCDGYVFLHRVLMEQKIGRYLNRNEVVHHINQIKTDNRIENLMLMTRSEHSSLHMKLRRKLLCSNWN